MSLDEKFIPVRDACHQIVRTFFTQIARLFGYPNNPGMPTISDLSNGSKFLDSLPRHKTVWPPVERPETWFEMIFGPTPKVEIVPRYIYESKEEGFYNFYIENYQNIYFLPDWLSEFIQVRLNICLDITFLETIREVIFVGLMVFSQLIVLRIALSWFISINPYIFPWYYLTGTVDWTEEILQGMVPTILGVNVTGSVFLGMLGKVADSLNHLVFTMPFLPSEGEATKLLINQQMKDVLVFHYLPILWYRYPIPNEIREFWYKERPDILNYMQKAYQNLDIQFLPDNILNQQRLSTNLTFIPNNSINSLSTEIVSKTNAIQPEAWLSQFHISSDSIQNFMIHSLEKLF
jgi:hypothetical protein